MKKYRKREFNQVVKSSPRATVKEAVNSNPRARRRKRMKKFLAGIWKSVAVAAKTKKRKFWITVGVIILLITLAIVLPLRLTKGPAAPPVQYSLTINSTAGGSVTTPGEGNFTYNESEIVELVATADVEYRFVNWTGDASAIVGIASANIGINMTENFSITANFAKIPPQPLKQYTLTISASRGGEVTKPGEGSFTYPAGKKVSLLAEPDSCYAFVEWTGDVEEVDDVDDASTKITMNGNYTITANFHRRSGGGGGGGGGGTPVVKYQLTINSTDCGNVTIPGEGDFTFKRGSIVSLIASPDLGCHFVNWTGDVSNIPDTDIDDPSTTIKMEGDYSITANFAQNVVVRYNLTVSSTEGGTVSDPGEGSFNYTEGTTVSLLADASPCHHFVEWTGDTGTIADLYDPSTTITMNGDYSIVANFEEDIVIRYDLTISSTAGGSVTTPGEGEFGPYLNGMVVSLIATPCSGYHFVNWTGDVGTVANPNLADTTIVMTGDYSIIANFAETPVIRYNLTISSTVGGSVTTPGEGQFGPYLEGTNVTLLADPDSCHRFVKWTGDTGNIANIYDASTKIKMEDDYSITANFAENVPEEYTLTVTSTSGGSVTTPGEGEFGPYPEGTEVSLLADPDSCHHFVEWTGDTGTIPDTGDPSTTITMDGDYSIVANFAEDVVEPEFNSCPGDKPTIRLANLNKGDSWDTEVEADPGDTIGFCLYYHNCHEGSIAENTRVKISFPESSLSQIVPTGHIWADNAQEVTGDGVISVSEPQRLKFDTTAGIKAWWYPNQGSETIILTPTITGTTIEVSIGDIEGGWDYWGHVVFRAKLID